MATRTIPPLRPTPPRSSEEVVVLSPTAVAARTVGVALILAYGALRITNAEWWDPLDDLNLAVHEAGHLVFGFFGETIGILGGSLFQVLVPVVFVGYFLRTRQRFAAGAVMAWVGVNLLNVSRYIGDASARELPLLGGDDSLHDWWLLLSEWDRLSQDVAIARAVHFCGSTAFVLAIVVAWLARRRR
jgi:hypothetical protein